MKNFKKIFAAIVLILMIFGVQTVKAQCAMCAASVATSHNSGNKQADGLNKGIMVLLAAPYLAVAAVGFIWYKRFKRKNVDLNMRNEKLNLN